MSSSTRLRICGFTDSTTIDCRAASELSGVARIPYFSASSRRRSSRGAEAVTCFGLKTSPRNRPRIMASAMFPAPTNPIDFSGISVLLTDLTDQAEDRSEPRLAPPDVHNQCDNDLCGEYRYREPRV